MRSEYMISRTVAAERAIEMWNNFSDRRKAGEVYRATVAEYGLPHLPEAFWHEKPTSLQAKVEYRIIGVLDDRFQACLCGEDDYPPEVIDQTVLAVRHYLWWHLQALKSEIGTLPEELERWVAGRRGAITSSGELLPTAANVDDFYWRWPPDDYAATPE